MDNIKAKLIELLITLTDKGGHFLVGSAKATLIADHLIANGVTLDNQVSSSKWISVKDRLPEPFTVVLVYDNDKTVAVAYMTRHKEWVGIVIRNEVTHWMPLPQPPKEE